MKGSFGTYKKTTWRQQFLEWIYSIFSAAFIAALLRWGVAGLYIISSGSMEHTLLKGDCVLISKLHYGARTPITPLQLPMTHRVIPFTKLKSYLDWIKLSQYRLPGLSQIKKNDVIVFNPTLDSLDVPGLPMDLRDYWIKRCVALPGDVVKIQDKQLCINGVEDAFSKKAQYRYFMRTKRIFSKSFFKKSQIQQGIPAHVSIEGEEGYHIYATLEKVEQLKKVLASSILSIESVKEPEGLFSPMVYPWHSSYAWNKDNFGPFRVPKKGMSIALDRGNISLYRHIIEQFEGKKEMQFLQDGCWIDGQKVDVYTFEKNYYFAMGDNRDQSKDSRFVGCIPEDHILGKAVCIVASSDSESGGVINFFKGMRWNRLLQRVNL